MDWVDENCSAATVDEPVASPCTGVCRIGASDVCIGCRRTLDEIAAWGGMTNAARRAVLDRLDREKAGANPD